MVIAVDDEPRQHAVGWTDGDDEDGGDDDTLMIKMMTAALEMTMD